LIEKDVWENCYERKWKKLIVNEAFCHPAKFSYNLIDRIYSHAMENGWIKKGDTVLDPFGGVALGALGAISNGMNWIGVELEKKFVRLGEENIAKWMIEVKRDLGTAKIIQGDSRKLKFYLAKLIGTPDMVISSPPYADSLSGSDKPQDHKRHQELATKAGHGRIGRGQLVYQNAYGRTLGNLSNMKDDGFWNASQEIIQQCYELIKPGGIAIWNVKDYLKNKEVFPFSDKWVEMNESVGFKVVCWHQATLLKVGQDLILGSKNADTFKDGDKVVQDITDRKGFFRRIQERKGFPKIDWENVICMVK